MGTNLKDENSTYNERLQGMLQCLSKCKIKIINEKDELKKLREENVKLELQIKEVQELQKSHRYHLQTSREMIGNLQDTVSQLVYLKRDVKKLKDEICSKDSTITALQREKEIISMQQNENLTELKAKYEKQIEDLTLACDKNVQQVQNDSDTQIAQFTCVIEELQNKMKDMETEHRDKMNVVVLDYEEKIQRSSSQVAQLQEQLARQAARTDSNIDAYRRRLEELEGKLKQNQFKKYLAQSSYPSQYDSQVERPYSVTRDFPETCSGDLEPVYEGKSKYTPASSQSKPMKQPTLQVMYYGNKTAGPTKAPEKKGQFNITKKRKLYNEKDFQDF